MTTGSSLRAIDILGEIWFTWCMNKIEAIAYLRKKQLLERLAVTTDTNAEAAEELSQMEKSSEKEEKDLTPDPSSV